MHTLHATQSLAMGDLVRSLDELPSFASKTLMPTVALAILVAHGSDLSVQNHAQFNHYNLSQMITMRTTREGEIRGRSPRSSGLDGE